MTDIEKILLNQQGQIAVMQSAMELLERRVDELKLLCRAIEESGRASKKQQERGR